MLICVYNTKNQLNQVIMLIINKIKIKSMMNMIERKKLYIILYNLIIFKVKFIYLKKVCSNIFF
jgi:hypothetical protein